MTIKEAYLNFWRKAFVMKGRARRKEYWIPHLINATIGLIIRIIFDIIDGQQSYLPDTEEWLLSDTASVVWLFIILIPSFTVAARRLQDININGWWAILPNFGWLLLILGILLFILLADKTGLLENHNGDELTIVATFGSILNVLNAIVFFILFVLDSNPRPNKYGEDPKQDERYYYRGGI
ncbi:DUF805 domain-containing protein [Macrococcus carouselicus]|uniref:DUF805 domain-containing protein n=1 Tax=Macrococcus carouselicus TaxID=69969 RepID=A0A9Q8CMA5_9STAP|nr:DUF805 domain-containing protein [Macrococcus carouselicus]TDM04616.1 DUF805 domain-containing protein [Macrococcus carouselicus]